MKMEMEMEMEMEMKMEMEMEDSRYCSHGEERVPTRDAIPKRKRGRILHSLDISHHHYMTLHHITSHHTTCPE